jgi:hypothetical protein
LPVQRWTRAEIADVTFDHATASLPKLLRAAERSADESNLPAAGRRIRPRQS